jgi:hypothetical protein
MDQKPDDNTFYIENEQKKLLWEQGLHEGTVICQIISHLP